MTVIQPESMEWMLNILPTAIWESDLQWTMLHIDFTSTSLLPASFDYMMTKKIAYSYAHMKRKIKCLRLF